MKSILFAGAALVLLGDSLATDYTQKRSLRVSLSASMETEVKSMKVERNGEPMDFPGGISSSNKRQITYVDTTLEHAGGKPTKVRRVFEDLANESTNTMGDRQSESIMKPRLSGVTLELTKSGDEVEIKAVEGKADEEALAGHSLALLLDAFLPPGDEDSWELDSAAIKRGIAIDVQKSLFAPPESSGGGEGGRGRSRGGMMGGSSGGVLSMAELEGKAERAEERVEHDGVECVVINIAIKGNGDLPQPEGGGEGGRGRMFDPSSGVLARGNTYSVELKGRLLFDPKSKRPLLLELSGSMELEQSSERTFNDMTIKSESVTGGEIEIEVAVSQVDD